MGVTATFFPLHRSFICCFDAPNGISVGFTSLFSDVLTNILPP